MLSEIPVCLLTVEVIDCHYEGEFELVCIAKGIAGSDLDALLGVDYEDTILADAEACVCAADEIIGTGGVENVDFLALELGVHGSRIDRPLVELLEFVEIGDGVLVLNGTAPVDNFSLKKHSFCKRSLTGLRCAQKDHVADVLC